MDIEFETTSFMENLVDNLIEESDIQKMETTEEAVTISLRNNSGRVIVKRFLKTDRVAVVYE